jgi:hypothetical protein
MMQAQAMAVQRPAAQSRSYLLAVGLQEVALLGLLGVALDQVAACHPPSADAGDHA